jgi:hypothetical protein
MAPTIRKGSVPVATASGSGVSTGSWDRSSPQLRNVVAHRALQHGIAGLQGVQDRARRDLARDIELYLAVHLR